MTVTMTRKPRFALLAAALALLPAAAAAQVEVDTIDSDPMLPVAAAEPAEPKSRQQVS